MLSVAQYPGIKVCSTLAYYIDNEGSRVAKTHHELTRRKYIERYMAENEAIGILNPGAFVDRGKMVEPRRLPAGVLSRQRHRPLGPAGERAWSS